MKTKDISFVFFGTPRFAVIVLNVLKQLDIVPKIIITAPDKPAGRGLLLTPPPVALWVKSDKEVNKANETKETRGKSIKLLQPDKIDDNLLADLSGAGFNIDSWDVFVVCAYGHMLPKWLLDVPKFGVLNVHPSLLPKFRGSSPIESVILSHETHSGVSIIKLDEEMDHGPILAQAQADIPNWPPKSSELSDILATLGGTLLADTLPKWINGDITAKDQLHDNATFTKKIKKTDAELFLDDEPERNIKKIKAYDVWPRAYYIHEHKGSKIRVVVTDAEISKNMLILKSVIPDGKNQMSYDDFVRGLK